MTDMPDTTTTAEPSHLGDGEQESDDAAGYYVPGDPLVDTKAPGGPSTSAGTPASSRPGSPTRPTVAASR